MKVLIKERCLESVKDGSEVRELKRGEVVSVDFLGSLGREFFQQKEESEGRKRFLRKTHCEILCCETLEESTYILDIQDKARQVGCFVRLDEIFVLPDFSSEARDVLDMKIVDRHILSPVLEKSIIEEGKIRLFSILKADDFTGMNVLSEYQRNSASGWNGLCTGTENFIWNYLKDELNK